MDNPFPLFMVVAIEILALVSVISFALQLAYVIPSIIKKDSIPRKRIVKTLLLFVCSVVLNLLNIAGIIFQKKMHTQINPREESAGGASWL